MTIRIRDASDDALAIVKRVLYEAVGWDPSRTLPPMEQAVEHPELAIYHRDWGRRGDLVVVAENGTGSVGGAFCRLFTEDQHGHGFYDEDTPEFGIAVWEGERGRRIGTRLLQTLEERAHRQGVETMSLSVESANSARGLYERLGYEVVEEREGDVLMLKRLN